MVPELEVFQCGGRDASRKLWERVVTVVRGPEGIRASAGAPLEHRLPTSSARGGLPGPGQAPHSVASAGSADVYI